MKLLATIVCFIVVQHVHASYLPYHLNDFESLLLYRMNFSADPCDNFYNYVCGNFDDSETALNAENTRILKTGLNELLFSKQHELFASSAIQKAVRYYGTCVRQRGTSDVAFFIRHVVQTFSNTANLKYDFFIKGDPDLWIDGLKWVKILKIVHDLFGVEPFFETGRVIEKTVGTNRILERKTYFTINNEELALATENEPYKYSCENRDGLLQEYIDAVQEVIDVMRLTATTDDVENIAKNMMDIEFRLGDINCDQTDEMVESESSESEERRKREDPSDPYYGYYTLPELRNQNWPVNMAEYVTSIIETGAGDTEVEYDKLSIRVVKGQDEWLSDFFEEIPDDDLLKYVYFRAIYKLKSSMDNLVKKDCINTLSNLAPIKSRIFTEFKYPSVWERESVRHITNSMTAAIKDELQKMMTSLPWVREDKATFDNLLSKLNKLKSDIVIDLNFLNDTWIDAYYNELKFGPTDSLLPMHVKVVTFNMYSKVRDLFSFAETHIHDVPTYDPEYNLFVVPADEFETPKFNIKFPLSYNMGLIGSTIGHEITHAFDTDGVNYDETGLYNPMLNESAKQKMQEVADCVINYYDKLDIVIDKNNVTHVNGSQTVAENMADIGGLDAAYRAFKTMERKFGQEKLLRHPQLRRLSHDQLFFIGFANYYCEKVDLGWYYYVMQHDSHTPNVPRVHGTLANLPAFAKAYHCPVGSAYASLKPCKVWTV